MKQERKYAFQGVMRFQNKIYKIHVCKERNRIKKPCFHLISCFDEVNDCDINEYEVIIDAATLNVIKWKYNNSNITKISKKMIQALKLFFKSPCYYHPEITSWNALINVRNVHNKQKYTYRYKPNWWYENIKVYELFQDYAELGIIKIKNNLYVLKIYTELDKKRDLCLHVITSKYHVIIDIKNMYVIEWAWKKNNIKNFSSKLINKIKTFFKKSKKITKYNSLPNNICKCICLWNSQNYYNQNQYTTDYKPDWWNK
jgi:hypothetical protein